MLEELIIIGDFIVQAFLHIWPYLLITIPLAVVARLSGASKFISKALRARPGIAILLATLVGAFSPFCSCGVVPVIAALLIGGVPLAPVMSFWIASPSMDPEIFFLSVATIGWKLALWRLTGTLLLSLAAGFLTHFFMMGNWLGQDILRTKQTPVSQGLGTRMSALISDFGMRLKSSFSIVFTSEKATPAPVTVCCSNSTATGSIPAPRIAMMPTSMGATDSVNQGSESCDISNPEDGCKKASAPVRDRLFKETWNATTMVVKFMLLAFFFEALIELYIPAEWISGSLGSNNPWAILIAAFLGVPAYTSNLAALPMIGGLLEQGMNPAAGLAFLIAGPTTTLPAMAAVWGIVSRRVFLLYILFSLAGAILLGYSFAFVG